MGIFLLFLILLGLAAIPAAVYIAISVIRLAHYLLRPVLRWEIRWQRYGLQVIAWHLRHGTGSGRAAAASELAA